MAKRKSQPKPEPKYVSPFFDGVRVDVEIKPGDGPFLALIDMLSAFATYDPEKEYDDRIAEGERQLEIIAAQIEAQQKRELARRAECRAKRLEREAVEKAAAEAGPKRKRQGVAK